MRSELATPQQISEVTSYIMVNRVPVIGRRGCVDGRYGAEQEVGKIARPGGDFGYVEALLSLRYLDKLRLTPEEIADRTYFAVKRFGGEFSMHTHCGHKENASNIQTASLYRVDPKEVQTAYDLIAGREVNLVPLHGAHQEKAVIAVVGEKHTVKPTDGKDMYFVYNKALDDQFMKKLVHELGIPQLTFQDMREASNRQLGTTLRLLAASQTIYAVDADPQEPIVVAFGRVPQQKAA